MLLIRYLKFYFHFNKIRIINHLIWKHIPFMILICVLNDQKTNYYICIRKLIKHHNKPKIYFYCQNKRHYKRICTYIQYKNLISKFYLFIYLFIYLFDLLINFHSNYWSIYSVLILKLHSVNFVILIREL